MHNIVINFYLDMNIPLYGVIKIEWWTTHGQYINRKVLDPHKDPDTKPPDH